MAIPVRERLHFQRILEKAGVGPDAAKAFVESVSDFVVRMAWQDIVDKEEAEEAARGDEECPI